MSVKESNKGHSFRTSGISYRGLCRYISELPGVKLTHKRRLFWRGGDVRAEFTFRGHAFQIEADAWDGALWVSRQRAFSDMNASNHPQVSTRPIFRVLAGCLSLLMLAFAPVWIYYGITESAWFAWLLGLITLFAGAGFAGGALTGHWFRFRRRDDNTAA
ncbi:MAG: hypothetical protein WBN75_06485 [Verrucomicrobiia bacterium]|jgi:hypothetical protein